MAEIDPKQLAPGTQMATKSGTKLSIIKILGEGGCGSVYEVDYGGVRKALKWYKDLGRDLQAFRKNLEEKIEKGSPSPAFLWPEDVTVWKEGTFGCVMAFRPEGYYEMSEFLIGRRIIDWKRLVDASINIIKAFYSLHNQGYCYQSLDDGNFFINPQAGDVIIVGNDNDNVARTGKNMGILGMPRYTAPEVILEKNLPNIASDQYSLAIVLFMLLLRFHPLEGKKDTPFVMTYVDARRIYGEKPIFIFDPADDSNRPDPEVGKHVIEIWKCLPQYMKDIFIRAFGKDSLEGGHRVVELEWLRAYTRFRSGIVRCSCGNGVFTENERDTYCDKCGKKMT